MIAINNLHWLAGIIEGEGCFSSIGGKQPKQLQICLQMTDEDIVVRAAKLLNTNVRGPFDRGNKPFWRISVGGRKAAGWMMILYSLMGTRRKAKIRELLSLWKSAESNRSPRGILQKPICHPDKLHKGHGWCSNCYSNNIYHYGTYDLNTWPISPRVLA